ncbi:heme-binding protein 1 [Procambarus clarkii]|uniref:heme-binding protein 1 n=1 Tax=Procambarus clarkii TaxID=6728 RepID=UPI001E6780A2|nr:heme-binding protein 1-like [Procambarus clarkii]XP_045618243.1 heme-binding protein 1-like [Procambarus clarkii]
MKLFLTVLVVAFHQAAAANLFTAFTRSFGPQEEVTFTSARENTEFEERVYPAKKWACTEQVGGYSDGDQIDVFLRLFAYIGGENDRQEKLVMGIPVSIEYKVEGGQKVYTACFFIPEAAQDNPPAPTNAQVVITPRPEMTVYTRKFGGYATDEATWTTEAEALTALVTAAGNQINPNLIYWNAYDPPFKFWNRRNEVWLLKI